MRGERLKALVLGAGFSKWAAGLPVAAQLFYMNINTRSEREHRRLAVIDQDFKSWRKANPVATAEAFVQWSLARSPRHARRIIWYVARRLSDEFLTPISGGTTALMIDEKRTSAHEGVLRAREFLSAIGTKRCSGIVTPNYDLLVEYALVAAGSTRRSARILHGRGINPLFPWQNSGAVLSGALPVAKIHGSLSWTAERSGPVENLGLNGDALIVAPTPEKDPPEPLRPVWTLAEGILSPARELVFFGFAFTPNDEAVLKLSCLPIFKSCRSSTSLTEEMRRGAYGGSPNRVAQ